MTTTTRSNAAMSPKGGVERIAGQIVSVKAYKPDSGWAVLKVRLAGQREPATVIGHVTNCAGAGQKCSAEGVWTTHRQWGPQFKASRLEIENPSSSEGIVKFLSSGMVKGIGPEFARTLVEAFGDQTLEVLEKEPHRINEIKGIGPKRAEALVNALSEHRAVQEIMVFLHTHGLGANRAKAVYDRYGDQAVERIKENPYRLSIEVEGIGFLIADGMARSLGIAHDSMERVRAGLHHALLQAANNGHCALPAGELLKESRTLLQVSDDHLRRGIELEIAERQLLSTEIEGLGLVVYLPRYWYAERKVARGLKRLMSGAGADCAPDLDKALAEVEARNSITLAGRQREAVRLGAVEKVLVITGGPGCGKTTTLKALLEFHSDKRVLLCAPTGRAAKRMGEATKRDASTIHRLLGVSPAGGFKFNADNKLEADVVVIDEMSMVDVQLMAALVEALPDHAILILVGDKDQLPSVGAGAVLRDLIESKAIPVVELNEIFRQAQGSMIVVNAHRINNGQMPLAREPGKSSDFYYFKVDGAHDEDRPEVYERIRERILEAVTVKIPQTFGLHSIKDIQVLTPMHGGALGTQALNEALQKALNPSQGVRLTHGQQSYAVGDKVIQLSNDYDRDVFNGDMGRVVRIELGAGLMWVDMEGRVVEYKTSDLINLSLAYAKSIHKSQGSEYPAVVIPLTTQHTIMLERQLIYTGITRGRQLVLLIGQERALKRAVRTVTARQRVTNLARLLAA